MNSEGPAAARYHLALFGPDVSFASGGFAEVPAGDVLLPLPDGRILVVGHRSFPVPGFDSPDDRLMVVSRVNADGTPDASFHGDGSVELARTFVSQDSQAVLAGVESVAGG